MKILINGQEAVLKADASFEYVSENPLFTEAEDYTMEIVFPMKDCPQNILIFGPLHVDGVDISKVSFPCEIQDGHQFYKSGILTITSVSEKEVNGQFLEGMSSKKYASNLLNLYIDEIDLSAYDGTDTTEESVARVNGSGWDNLLVFDSNKDDFFRTKEEVFRHEIHDPNLGITIPVPAMWNIFPVRHIYLYKLIEILSEILDIDIDASVLNNMEMFPKIMIANATYDLVGDYMNLEKSLPHWTVREFFEHIGKFFGCICCIDASCNSLKIKPKSDMMKELLSINVLDDFSVELQDKSTATFAGNKKFALPDECNDRNLNGCSWIFDNKNLFSIFSTSSLKGVIQKFALGTWQNAQYLRTDAVFELGKAGNAWAVICDREERKDIAPDVKSEYFLRYEVLNQYGDCFEGEELKIIPCNLQMKKLRIGYMFPIEENSTGSSGVDYALYYRCPVLEPTLSTVNKSSNIMASLEGGKKGYDPCDKLQLVFHTGEEQWFGYHLNTKKYEVDAGTEYAEDTKIETAGEVPLYSGDIREYGYTLSPNYYQIQEYSALPKVDESKLYRYKFLAQTLPAPTNIFLINGKKFACLRLTAHFSVFGMSQLVEGEFYEIID